MPAGELDGALVGLGTAVGEEHPAGDADQLDQPLGQPNAGLVDRQVGRVRQRHDLAADGLDDRRVSVAEGGDRDPGDEIEILAAVVVPYPDAVTVVDLDRRSAVVGHHDRVPTVRQRHSGSFAGSTIVPIPSVVNTSSSKRMRDASVENVRRGDPALDGA